MTDVAVCRMLVKVGGDNFDTLIRVHRRYALRRSSGRDAPDLWRCGR